MRPLRAATTSAGSAGAAPCPPSGTHRYDFTLYALAEPLGLPGQPDGGAVRKALDRANVLGKAVLEATYRARRLSLDADANVRSAGGAHVGRGPSRAVRGRSWSQAPWPGHDATAVLEVGQPPQRRRRSRSQTAGRSARPQAPANRVSPL